MRIVTHICQCDDEGGAEGEGEQKARISVEELCESDGAGGRAVHLIGTTEEPRSVPPDSPSQAVEIFRLPTRSCKGRDKIGAFFFMRTASHRWHVRNKETHVAGVVRKRGLTLKLLQQHIFSSSIPPECLPPRLSIDIGPDTIKSSFFKLVYARDRPFCALEVLLHVIQHAIALLSPSHVLFQINEQSSDSTCLSAWDIFD